MFPADYYCHYSKEIKNNIISCSNKNTGNYACNKHAQLVPSKEDASFMYDHVEMYVTEELKIYYQENTDAEGKKASALSCKKIYDLLFEHPIFLVKNIKFLVVTYNKLFEFKKTSDIKDYFNVPLYIDKIKELTGIACMGEYIFPEQAIPLKLKATVPKQSNNAEEQPSHQKKLVCDNFEMVIDL